MSRKANLGNSCNSGPERLTAPFTDVVGKIRNLELFYDTLIQDDVDKRQGFRDASRKQRLTIIGRHFKHETTEAEKQLHRIVATDEEALLAAQITLEAAQNKLANVLGLRRGLMIAEFIADNRQDGLVHVGTRIADSIGRDAGTRVLGHVARFGAMLVESKQAAPELDLDEVIAVTCSDDSHRIAAMGSVVVVASTFKKDLERMPDMLILTLSHDPDLFSLASSS